ncbi:hypothetical protein [Gracilibacillus alcaliphilus]|nr:hypothetical protein [Gracilibacillus alcaliphilus]
MKDAVEINNELIHREGKNQHKDYGTKLMKFSEKHMKQWGME